MVNLELTNEEFDMVRQALQKSSYSSMRERETYLSLANRLHHIYEASTRFETMGEGFDLFGIVEV